MLPFTKFSTQDVPLQIKQTNNQQQSNCSKNIDVHNVNSSCTIDDDDVTVAEDGLTKTNHKPGGVGVQYGAKISRLRAIGHQIR